MMTGEERKQWIAQIKVGDRVAVRSESNYGPYYYVYVVKHITPSRNRIDIQDARGVGAIYPYDKHGYRASRSRFALGSEIEPVTDAIAAANKRVLTMTFVNKIDWTKQPDDVVAKVAEIVQAQQNRA